MPSINVTEATRAGSCWIIQDKRMDPYCHVCMYMCMYACVYVRVRALVESSKIKEWIHTAMYVYMYTCMYALYVSYAGMYVLHVCAQLGSRWIVQI